MKGMTEREISIVLWVTIAVIIFILILGAGLYFYNKAIFQGVFS